MKRLLSTILLAFFVMAGQAKEKTIVWEQPATESGTDYGDGYFYLALGVTKVELKADKTVVYITATQRSDNNHLFQFTGDTYPKAGEQSSGMQRFTLVSADGIELNKFVKTNNDGRRDGKGDRRIVFFEDYALYDCKFWNYDQCNVNSKTGEADFDIQYLYLANRSPQTSWENVIKEYNVSGPNVAHYNLPEEQQTAIEHHLNVHSWPTYKLFDRNGNLLDLQVDPRDLENLARLLEGMK